ncbi:MAG: hypothetical protein K0S74_1098 [Chlamydiales bacterium]|jgi:hypothetical protein|nr:hypothetical protein [Chlamydiales bacterium]
MASNNLKDEEIYLIAEQIILGEKTQEDVKFLDEDDRARVNAIVHRGIEGLSKSSRANRVKIPHSALPSDCSPEEAQAKINPHYVAQKKKEFLERKAAMLYTLTRHIAFRVFPIEKLKQEKEIISRRLVEELVRTFSSEECAILFAPYSEMDLEPLFHAMSPVFAEDVQFHMQRLSEEELSYNFDSLAAKYSVITASFLQNCEEISDELNLYINEYLTRLRADLKMYCIQLPERFKLEDKLSKFSPLQWQKLAGFTPRRDMASIAAIIPERWWNALVNPLPSYQKEDLDQLTKLHTEKQMKHLTAFIDTIESLKRWITYINKVIEIEKEDRRIF